MKTNANPWVWLERALFLLGLLCLGIWAWVWLDARLLERRENALLEKAAQTDARALATFRPAAQPAPPLDSGALIGRIAIPRVGVTAIVLQGVEAATLRRAAGHIPETALPSEASGNVGIAAHRDSFFRGLKDIRKGDPIELTTLDGTYRYRVEWTRIVQPSEVSVLARTAEPTLTLVTCYPFYYVGSAPKRFIVRAVRLAEGVVRR